MLKGIRGASEGAQQDSDTSQQEKSEVVLNVPFSSDGETPKVIKPGKESLHFPPLAIAS